MRIEDKKTVKKHYGLKDLHATIVDAYKQSGKEINTHEDTSEFDEFHIRGREATREMAELSNLKKGMSVLDLGSGVGGTARFLAAEYECHVTGVDLAEEYCQIAANISDQVGLSHLVQFKQGDITDLPIDDNAFDIVWIAHVNMNILNKKALISEAARVLKAGGTFAVYEICAGNNTPPHFPVPWAEDPSISFLVKPQELRTMLIEKGFKEKHWRDVSEISKGWFINILNALRDRPSDAPPPLGINLLMGSTAGDKTKNVLINLNEDRVRVVQGIFELNA